MEKLEKISAAVKKYGEVLLLWLLCVMSESAAAYIYTERTVSGCVIFSAVLSALLIWLFGALRKRKWGGFAYVALLVLVVIISSVIVGRGWETAFLFIRWFFSGAQAEETRASFMMAFSLSVGFFLTSSFYYFTRVIYRSSMLALVSLIPFALAVKAAAAMPAPYPMVIASLNLFFIIIDGRKKLAGNSAQGGSAAVVYTDFAVAAVLLALLLPKPTETPYYEKFEEIISVFSFGGSGETVFRGEFKDESGGAEELLKGESKLIYIVTTADPVYMKSQVFDLYDRNSGVWVPLQEVLGSKKWQDKAKLLNYELLGKAIKAAAENDSGLYSDKRSRFYEKYPFAENFPDIKETESFSLVYARDFAAQYIIAPLRAADVNLSGVRGVTYCARSDAGEIFANVYMPSDAGYTVRYYSEAAQNIILDSGFCEVSFEDYWDFLEDVYMRTEIDSEDEEVILEYISEYRKARAYKEAARTAVSAEIQALADEITAGLDYDFQKAWAIEQYFHGGGYLYDLGYEPPEGMDTPEYFIFESKRGICSDYATAYTLLARAAGLTVRYAEGFVPKPSEESEGVYYIMTDNAHAYPEVYIPGAGWVIYDPTPSNLGGGSGGAGDGGNLDYESVLLTAAVFVAGFGAFILIVLLMPIITECIFRIRVRSKGGSKAVIMLYNRHIRNAETRLGTSLAAYTPEQAAVFTEMHTGLSLEPLTKPFTEACYGGSETDNREFETAYSCYKEQVKSLKNKKGRNKK